MPQEEPHGGEAITKPYCCKIFEATKSDRVQSVQAENSHRGPVRTEGDSMKESGEEHPYRVGEPNGRRKIWPKSAENTLPTQPRKIKTNEGKTSRERSTKQNNQEAKEKIFTKKERMRESESDKGETRKSKGERSQEENYNNNHQKLVLGKRMRKKKSESGKRDGNYLLIALWIICNSIRWGSE